MEKSKTPRELLAELREDDFADEILPCGEYVTVSDFDNQLKLHISELQLTADQVRKRIGTMLVALEYMDEFNRLLAKENSK